METIRQAFERFVWERYSVRITANSNGAYWGKFQQMWEAYQHAAEWADK